MGFDLFVTGFAIYFGITYMIGFLWMLLDQRIDNGRIYENDVHEAMFFSMFSFLWVPIRILVTLVRCLRGLLMWVFNDLF